MGKNIILTGDRPTGPLHIGHYVGSLKRRVALQESGKFDEIYILIADAQALTDNAQEPEKVRDNIIQVTIDYLSAGLDPEKTTVCIQSQLPALYELTAYYMNLVTTARLERNPTVKSEIKLRGFNEGGVGIPVGFYTYPISQASDITAFKANCVPVGEDQMPMLEQCREIVHKFNTTYDEVLVMPEILLNENEVCRRLPGTDGKAKMSKSLGNCIYLGADEKTLHEKVFSMYTDPDHINISDPGKVEGNAVFTYLDAFATKESFERHLPEYKDLDEMKEHYKKGGLGDVKCKRFLERVLNDELAPIREDRIKWEADIPAIYEILKKGTEKAREVTEKTLSDVKRAMKINYFDDDMLLSAWDKR